MRIKNKAMADGSQFRACVVGEGRGVTILIGFAEPGSEDAYGTEIDIPELEKLIAGLAGILKTARLCAGRPGRPTLRSVK